MVPPLLPWMITQVCMYWKTMGARLFCQWFWTRTNDQRSRSEHMFRSQVIFKLNFSLKKCDLGTKNAFFIKTLYNRLWIKIMAHPQASSNLCVKSEFKCPYIRKTLLHRQTDKAICIYHANVVYGGSITTAI